MKCLGVPAAGPSPVSLMLTPRLLLALEILWLLCLRDYFESFLKVFITSGGHIAMISSFTPFVFAFPL